MMVLMVPGSNYNRYLDYVTNIDTDGKVRAYKCMRYHT